MMKIEVDEEGTEWSVDYSDRTGDEIGRINLTIFKELAAPILKKHADSINRAYASMANTSKEVEQMLKLLNNNHFKGNS